MMSHRPLMVLVACLALAAQCFATESRIDHLKSRLRGLGSRRSHRLASSGGSVGSTSAAAAAATAASNTGGSAAAAAAASSTSQGHAHYPYGRHRRHQYQPAHTPVGSAYPVGGGYHHAYHQHQPAARYHTAPVYQSQVVGQHAGNAATSSSAAAASSGGNSGGAAAAAATTNAASNAAPVYQQHRPHFTPPRFERPVYRAPVFSAAPVQPHYVAAPAASTTTSAAAAASAGASTGAGGHNVGAAAAATAAAGAHHEHVPDSHSNFQAGRYEQHDLHEEVPDTNSVHAASSGTYANDGNGYESSSYTRSTENVENHEDGREDEDHYYNAHSYGKTYDENKNEAYNTNDEDEVHTPNLYRKKKSTVNYSSNFNKAQRESGSGVLAKDRHSASYNKNSRRFNENVDQRHHKNLNGVVDSTNFASANSVDDEDEEVYDSDNLGTFVGSDGHHHPVHHRAGLHGGAAASSAVNGNSVSTSAAAGGGAASSSVAGTNYHH